MISKKIILKSNYKEIKKAREEFKKFSSDNGLEFDKIFYIEVVIGEVTANIVEHGISKFNKDIIFSINILETEEVELIFEYTGNYISFDTIKDYTELKEVEAIEELESEGRGLFLIHEIMDEVIYESKEDGKIIIKMIKK